MSSPSPKAALFAQFAEVAKALAHTHRLVILELLGQRERSVEDLATAAHLSLANDSQHLRLMRRAGLLVSRRDGKQVLYRLGDPAVLDLIAALHRVGERNMAEAREIVRGYFRKRDSMEPVTRQELAARMKDGLVTILDVRPEDEFEAGHLPYANSPCDCAGCRRIARSSRTAAVSTASSPSKPWRCCARTDSGRAASKAAFRNGKPRACQLRDGVRARLDPTPCLAAGEAPTQCSPATLPAQIEYGLGCNSHHRLRPGREFPNDGLPRVIGEVSHIEAIAGQTKGMRLDELPAPKLVAHDDVAQYADALSGDDGVDGVHFLTKGHVARSAPGIERSTCGVAKTRRS